MRVTVCYYDNMRGGLRRGGFAGGLVVDLQLIGVVEVGVDGVEVVDVFVEVEVHPGDEVVDVLAGLGGVGEVDAVVGEADGFVVVEAVAEFFDHFKLLGYSNPICRWWFIGKTMYCNTSRKPEMIGFKQTHPKTKCLLSQYPAGCDRSPSP